MSLIVLSFVVQMFFLDILCFFAAEILTEDQKKEELDKLYAAIGYSENEVITAFPKEVNFYFGYIGEIREI